MRRVFRFLDRALLYVVLAGVVAFPFGVVYGALTVWGEQLSDADALWGRVYDLESQVGDTSGVDDLASTLDDLEYELAELRDLAEEAQLMAEQAGSDADDVRSRLEDMADRIISTADFLGTTAEATTTALERSSDLRDCLNRLLRAMTNEFASMPRSC